MKDEDNITISIPSQLAKRIEKRYKKAGFKSMSGYVTYVLRQVLLGIEAEDSKQNQNTKVYNKEEEKEVEKKLKKMGYL